MRKASCCRHLVDIQRQEIGVADDRRRTRLLSRIEKAFRGNTWSSANTLWTAETNSRPTRMPWLSSASMKPALWSR